MTGFIAMKRLKKGRSGFACKYIKGTKILDVGCGGSAGAMHQVILESNATSQVVGIDIDSAHLRKLKSFSSNLVLGSAEKLPFKSASFDSIYIGELIEHFWSGEGLLSEAHRVLKEGAVIALDTPNVYSLERIAGFVLKGKDSLGDPDHKLFYTPASISKTLNKAGFEVITVTSDRKFSIAGKMINMDFAPFRWLGTHLCVAARKVKQGNT